MRITHISLTIAALYTIIIGIIMLHAGQPTSTGWFTAALPMLAWATGPVFLFLLFISTFRSCSARSSLLAFQIIFFVLSVCTYYDAFYVHLDAQSGLVFLFMPMWQYVAVIVIVVIVRAAQLISKKMGVSVKRPRD